MSKNTEEECQEKEHRDEHHLLSTSRITEAFGLLSVKIRGIIKHTKLRWKNKRKKPIKKHRAWHFLFNNRYPCEAINMIKTGRVKRYYNKQGKKLSQEQIDKLTMMEEKWREVFRSASENRAVIIIKRYWTPRNPKGKCLCFQFEKCFEFHNPKKICPLLGLRIKKKKNKKKLVTVNLGRRKVSSPF